MTEAIEKKTAEQKLNATETTVLALMSIIIMPFAVVLRGFILSYLWTWFIVPLGVQQIGMAHCYGIALCCSFCCSGATIADPGRTFHAYVFNKLMFPLPMLVGWAIGYVCHLFM